MSLNQEKMKLQVLFLFLIAAHIGSAQTFLEVPQLPPFENVFASSIAFADVDGDGDQDVLISGFSNSFGAISKLYINDGKGKFTEKTDTPFSGVADASIAFADIDGDNDQDVIISGTSFLPFGPSTKLYVNDGQGNFTEKTDTTFAEIANGSIAFADVDGDNDPDVLITGGSSFGSLISKLYINDGQGSYTEKTDTIFDGVSSSSIAFADVDGDNDPDLLVTGQVSS
jgi:hypothetical protein